MKRNYYITLCLLALATIGYKPLAAQDTKLVTLDEAIELSIKNSNQLKNNRALIDEASASLKEVMDARLPEVSFGGSYMYLPIAPKINSNIKSGGDSGATGPGVKQAMYGMASASLPIYAGGRLKYGIESAKYLEQAATLDADAAREDVIFNTIDAFANLYKAKAALSIVKENLAEANQRVKDFSNLEQNGLLARNDLLKAELLSSNVELTLLDAENNWKLANTNMVIMLGLPKQTVLVPDSASFQQAVSLKAMEEYENLAYQNRKDMEALSNRRKAAQSGIKIARADYYPSIALTGGYAAVDVPNLLSAYNVVNVGVGVKYSLSSLWKTDAKVHKAKATELQLVAKESMLKDNVELQVNKVYQQYLLSKKKIEVYNQAVNQADENYKITKNKYDNGLATTTDLLDADVARMQAGLNYTLSKTDAMVSYNKLLQTAGLLYNNK